MASEFYTRTKSLFEEFQKRELHYLKTEEILNSNRQITNDTSLHLQDYLQKLNKREREAEDTYRDLMNNMEQLDRRAEKISENLDKLTTLKTSMTSNLSSWSPVTHSQDYFSPDCNYSSSFPQNLQDLNYTALNTIQGFSSQSKNVNQQATQTDFIICENCHARLILYTEKSRETFGTTSLNKVPFLTNIENTSNLPMSGNSENVTFSGVAKQVSSQVEKENINSIVTLENSETASTAKFQASDVLNPSNDIALSTDIVSENKNTFKCASTSKEIISVSENLSVVPNLEQSLPISKSIDELEVGLIQENAVNVSVIKQISEKNQNKVYFNDPQAETSLTSDTDKISKSDDESLNHEFDFLESDKKCRKSNAKQVSKPTIMEDNHDNDATVNSNLISQNKNSDLNEVKEKVNTSILKQTLTVPLNIKEALNSSQNIEDKISESSVSVGGERSPSIRSENISDSDSINEKEEIPFKASAAYQALLGNVSLSKTTLKPTISDSDSEDEIEQALAKAAIGNKNITESLPIKEEKAQDIQKSITEVKPNIEPRKSITATKPQQLSKKTRRVLGFDTSSGSEGEIQIQTNPKTKKDEDSDEFDFYD